MEDNHGLDRALAWSEETGKPLLILEALRAGYRWACPRHHRFILDGMEEHAERCAEAGVRYYAYVEDADGQGKGLLRALAREAAVVVTDRHPGFFYPRMLEAAAAQLDCRLEAVDSVGLLPLDSAPGPLPSAYVLRRRMQKHLPDWLDRNAHPAPLNHYAGGHAAVPQAVLDRWPERTTRQLGREHALETRVELAFDVPAVATRGGARAAAATLDRFADEDLERYDALRLIARPSSGLSAALHYGMISPHRVLRKVLRRAGTSVTELLPALREREAQGQAKGQRHGWWGLDEQAETFLDQVVTWRELGQRFADQNRDCEQYGSQPDWAVATLDAHRDDAREFTYSPRDFERGQTHDAIWNAAQNCLVREGWMPNYLRMLWAKLVLGWSARPEQAWDTLFHLNNLYALDGRDPNSMSGITWCFGRFDRPFGPERPVIGKLRPMSAANTRKKMELGDFLERYARQDGPASTQTSLET